MTVNLAILISGGGRSLQNFIDLIAAGKLDAKIQVVVSSTDEAGGNERARKAGIPVVVIERKRWPSAELFSEKVTKAIDGYPVEVDGSHHTIVVVAEDVKGSVARIAGMLSDDGVNIATLRLTRKHRGGDAFMVIELDERPGDHVGKDLKSLPWVRWTHRIDKVGG